MTRSRVTRFGLLLALLGWVVLIADAVAVPFLGTAGSLATVAGLRSDVFSVAETTILSGFALAILGALQAGFGGLNRFFEAVLERADGARPAAQPAPAAHPQPPSHHAEIPPVVLDPDVVDVVAVDTAPPRPTPSKPAAKPAKAHNYTILANGAVEVETLLGTRVFASLDEARDYIR